MQNHQVDSRFQEILQAAKERRGDMNVDSMIVNSHLAQMRMFMLRRGVEFYCDQDSFGGRKEFIRKLMDHNQLDQKLESVIDYFLCDGKGLFYFRPSGESYQILFFPKDRYRAYYDAEGNIEEVLLTYSFRAKPTGFMNMPDQLGHGKSGQKKYIKLTVTKDKIIQTVADEAFNLDNETPMQAFNGRSEELTNSLGFIPAVEVLNYQDCTGDHDASGEFDWLAHQILSHDDLVKNVRKNLKFYGNPTLISSRPKHDLIESGDEGATFRPTISSQAGFSAMTPSTRVSQPFGGVSNLDGQIKVPRVIANLEPTDRVGYITPDAISGDQNNYVKTYRGEIRLALGGVDDIDVQTSSTAYELKSLYGRVSSTALKKCSALYDYGLCKLFSLIIYHEETLFQESLCNVVGLKKPVIPLEEDFQEDPRQFEKAYKDFIAKNEKFVGKRNNLIQQALQTGMIPPGTTGLIPDGSTRVSWRWCGEIFEDDTQDILNNSIVVRNLQELGVDSIEALRYLFPHKTDEERAAMLSGFPFRMVQATQQSMNSFLTLLQQLYTLPHPQTPNLPLASDPNLDVTGFLYRSLEFLRKELSYSGKYSPTDSELTPDELSAADKLRAQLGRPVRDEQPVQLPGSAPGSSPTGGPIGGQPMAGGVSGPQRKPEYAAPIPGPGRTLAVQPVPGDGLYGGQLGLTGPGTGNGATGMGSPGAPDLSSFSFNPGLFGAGGGQPAAAAGRKPAKRKR